MATACRVECGSRESPGRRVTFFCFAKRKSPKKRRPPVCDPCASLRGKPASCRLWGAPWNSLCAARAAQTATASQFTKHGRFDAHAHPATAPPQAQPAGGGQPNIQTTEQPNIHSGHRCARPRLRSARRLRPRAAAERSDGPCGCSDPLPLWMRRGAQGLADQGSRLSERSEFERDPAKPEHRRLPRSEAQGTQTVGSPFFWVLFFGEAKKSASPAGRLPASALNKGTQTDSSTSSSNLSQVFLGAEGVLSKT